MEGTGSYGVALTALLRSQGFEVVEVNRPNRQMRRLRGKTDPIDAEAAARSILSGTASAVPKSHDGTIESIRLLRISLSGLRKCSTALTNSLRNVLVGAPPDLRDQLESMTTGALLQHCSRLRVAEGAPADPREATKSTLRLLSRQVITQGKEMDRLRSELTDLVRRVNPALLAAPGSALTAHPHCSSPQATIPKDCTVKHRSLPCAGSRLSRRPQESTPVTASTAAEIVKPTTRSGGSR